jgi:hypothetical protein
VDLRSDVFGTREETACYVQGVLDDYFAMGVRSCRHQDVQAVDGGTSHRAGTVTWELIDQVANVVTSWRESYLLVNDTEDLIVRSSIDR